MPRQQWSGHTKMGPLIAYLYISVYIQMYRCVRLWAYACVYCAYENCWEIVILNKKIIKKYIFDVYFISGKGFETGTFPEPFLICVREIMFTDNSRKIDLLFFFFSFFCKSKNVKGLVVPSVLCGLMLT